MGDGDGGDIFLYLCTLYIAEFNIFGSFIDPLKFYDCDMP